MLLSEYHKSLHVFPFRFQYSRFNFNFLFLFNSSSLARHQMKTHPVLILLLLLVCIHTRRFNYIINICFQWHFTFRDLKMVFMNISKNKLKKFSSMRYCFLNKFAESIFYDIILRFVNKLSKLSKKSCLNNIQRLNPSFVISKQTTQI